MLILGDRFLVEMDRPWSCILPTAMPVARDESCKEGGDLWLEGWGGGDHLQGAMNMSCHIKMWSV